MRNIFIIHSFLSIIKYFNIIGDIIIWIIWWYSFSTYIYMLEGAFSFNLNPLLPNTFQRIGHFYCFVIAAQLYEVQYHWFLQVILKRLKRQQSTAVWNTLSGIIRTLTNVSPPQTSCRFSCLTSNKLHSACRISNNCVTCGQFNNRTHFRYSLTSHIAHMAPKIKTEQKKQIELQFR